jgi:hypothetical protein
VRLASGDDEIVRLILLQHLPHRLDEFGRVAPVAPRVEIAKVQAVLNTRFDTCDGATDLA